MRLTTSSSNSLAAGSNPYGPFSSCACDQSQLAMRAIRFSLFCVTWRMTLPNWICCSNESSREGLMTTISVSGINASGTMTPQSSGNTEAGPAADPKFTEAVGISSSFAAFVISIAKSRSTLRVTVYEAPFSSTDPCIFSLFVIANMPSILVPCGVSTIIVSGLASFIFSPICSILSLVIFMRSGLFPASSGIISPP